MSDLATNASSKHVPLCVDLDGTLVQTDTLYENLIGALKTKGSLALLLPWLCLRGKAHLKERLALSYSIDASLLPYNRPLLQHLQQEHQSGRPLYLATAANTRIAQAVTQHLGIFAGTFASDHNRNLRGSAKAAALNERFGAGNYDYAGNGPEDLEVWKHARRALLVHTPTHLEKTIRDRHAQQISIDLLLPKPKFKLKAIAQALRVHQWSKNLLLFVPLILGKVTSLPSWLHAAASFTAMSLAASAVYLINDAADLEADRAHHHKADRPFAAGTLDIRWALVLPPLLLLLSAAIAYSVSGRALALIGGYLLLTTAYTFWLKRIAIADTLTLAGLYSWRLILGGVAAQVVISEWALAFSCFFFLSLAFVKRVSEVLTKINQTHTNALQHTRPDKAEIKGRGYVADDLLTLQVLGGGSGYLAVLVFALYLNGAHVHELYTRPVFLWLLCPLLIYWISRVWLLTNRNQMHADPVIFALRDPVSYVVGSLGVIVWLLASFK